MRTANASISLDTVLRAALRDVVTEALDERIAELAPPKPGPLPLLDRAGLAAALAVSIPTVDKLRRRSGFPTTMVMDAPRFDLARVRAWLDQNGGTK